MDPGTADLFFLLIFIGKSSSRVARVQQMAKSEFISGSPGHAPPENLN